MTKRSGKGGKKEEACREEGLFPLSCNSHPFDVFPANYSLCRPHCLNACWKRLLYRELSWHQVETEGLLSAGEQIRKSYTASNPGYQQIVTLKSIFCFTNTDFVFVYASSVRGVVGWRGQACTWENGYRKGNSFPIGSHCFSFLMNTLRKSRQIEDSYCHCYNLHIGCPKTSFLYFIRL